MSDSITRLNAALEGRYRIERELGEGGMATVYLARDEKHNRNVALKVLKPELAAVVGAERFLAEIETTANLQHPHILPLHDSGEADGMLFYVMPYVEGESLRERLDREHQLPVDEAVGIATNVAEALGCAHSDGVIHRDVKPANILLQAGKPVVSDFGIALALSSAGGHRLTETGLSLGTPHYMSPEQATGDQHVGSPTDIWALGCVLYEMLVGEPPYTGSTPQAILGRIITGEAPSARSQRSSVPPNVDAAIRRALEKLPADRFPGTQAFARALSDPGFAYAAADAAPDLQRRAPWSRVSTILGWTTAAALAAVALWAPRGPGPMGEVARFERPFRDDQSPVVDPYGRMEFDLSADGSALVYRGPGDRLWIRRWREPDASPIEGTEGVELPSLSPDGRQLAFRVQGGEVRVLSFDGGPSRPLIMGARGYTPPVWGTDGNVYVLLQDGSTVSVPVTGGPPDRVIEPAEGERWVRIADVLPGGRAALLEVWLADDSWEVRALDLASGLSTHVTEGSAPRFLPSGHLLFAANELGLDCWRRGLYGGPACTLMAAPFDAARPGLTGPAIAIIPGMLAYAVSRTGDLVYTRAATLGEVDTEFVWVDRRGNVEPVGWAFAGGGGNMSWRLSPDGTKIATRALTAGNPDIWVKELPDGAPRRLTFDEGVQMAPWWTPNGRSVTYISEGSPSGVEGNVWQVRADGTEPPKLLVDVERGIRMGDWSPDGEWLVLRTTSRRDILAIRPGVDSEPVPLVATTEFQENQPALSPDGRWLAYASNETGRYEVWVRPFPNVDSGKHRVSDEGGRAPRWGHSGREIFYLTPGPDRSLVVARLQTTSGLRVEGRERLFNLSPDFALALLSDPYDVAPDDQRFLMARRRVVSTLVFVQNWFEELQRLVPN